MSPDPLQEKSDALREAKLRAQMLAADFETVFGHESKRTSAQKNVLDHLGVCAGEDSNSYRFNEARDGVALIAAGIHRDGAKSILKVIERQLSLARNRKPEKAKVKSKR